MTVLQVQFAIQKTEERKRAKLFSALLGTEVDAVNFATVELAPGGPARTGVAKSLLALYCDQPLQLVLTRNGASITLPIRGLVTIPADCSYSVSYPNGPDGTLPKAKLMLAHG